MTLYPAIDVQKFSGFTALKSRSLGLLTHAAACDYLYTPTSDVIASAQGVDLKALYSPEHGLSSVALDGEHVDNSRDPRTGLPVFSLYGPEPSADMLDGIDLMVIDLQDIGSRFYTYMWTMSQMLELCGERGVEVMVLDRPNPLGGETIRGLYTEPDCTSMVGRYAHGIPLVHGMTIGELARYFAAEHIEKPPDVTVTAVSEWPPSAKKSSDGFTSATPSTSIQMRRSRHSTRSRVIAAVACSHTRDNCHPDSSIVIVNADGSGRTTLVETGGFARPAWSSDGSRIAYSAQACRECTAELRYMNVDGTGSGVIFWNGHDAAWRP